MEPITREEKFMAAAAGQSISLPTCIICAAIQVVCVIAIGVLLLCARG